MYDDIINTSRSTDMHIRKINSKAYMTLSLQEFYSIPCKRKIMFFHHCTIATVST